MTTSKLPKKARYSNTDIVKRLDEVHDCLEKHIEITGKTFGSIRGEIRAVGKEVDIMKGQVNTIERAVLLVHPIKVDEKTGKAETIGFFSRLKRMGPAEALVVLIVTLSQGDKLWNLLRTVLVALDTFFRAAH